MNFLRVRANFYLRASTKYEHQRLPKTYEMAENKKTNTFY